MQTNTVFLQKQIKLLHGRSLPDSVLMNITKLKKQGYEYLFKHVDDPNLSDYQVINIMKILLIMRNYDYNALANKIIDLIQDKRISVRSYASVLLVTLLYLEEDFNNLNLLVQKSKKELVLILKKAVKEEILPKDNRYVEKYIKANDSP